MNLNYVIKLHFQKQSKLKLKHASEFGSLIYQFAWETITSVNTSMPLFRNGHLSGTQNQGNAFFFFLLKSQKWSKHIQYPRLNNEFIQNYSCLENHTVLCGQLLNNSMLEVEF